jgi:ketosteroid isomerase-like protein
MPRNDVEVVLAQFEAVNARSFDRAMSLYADDVELDVESDAFLTSGVFKGRDAVGRWFGDWFSTFEPGYRFEIDEAREVNGSILIVATHMGRGRSSGIEVSGQTGYLYSVKGRRVTRVAIYADRESAYRAAGVDV